MSLSSTLERKNGRLFFEGHDLTEIARGAETPIYAYFESQLRRRIQFYQTQLRQTLPQSQLHFHYALKANSHPQVLKTFLSLGFGADIVSGGEMKRAMAAGISAEHIVFSGVGKTKKEIEQALQNQVGQINVESEPELQRIENLVSTGVANVALRFNPDVDVKTHPYIATGFRENKFGLDLESLRRCLEIIKKSKKLKLAGLTIHIGSQLKDFAALGEALRSTKKLLNEIKSDFGQDLIFDIGGGVGIEYESDESKDTVIFQNYLNCLKENLSDWKGQIQFEPGRFLVARSGILLSRVEYVKITPFQKFVILNTGMHHLMRPALYQAHHRILPLHEREGRKEKFQVVGPVCESSDFIGRDREMSPTHEGDLMAIMDVGAYGASMMSGYNCFEFATEKWIP